DVRVGDAITRYVVEIAARTRADRSLLAGVSPRGTLHLCRAAQAFAMVEGRDYVTPDDVKALAVDVLAHRVVEKRSRASAEGRAAAQQRLEAILKDVPVPQ